MLESPIIEKKTAKPEPVKSTYATGVPSPAAAKIMSENNVQSGQVSGTGKDGRILKSDVLNALSGGIEMPSTDSWSGSREVSREKLSMLRRKLPNAWFL